MRDYRLTRRYTHFLSTIHFINSFIILKGLPATFTPVSSSTVLTNVGVGMRKKNLYITEVDVYLCGLNLSPNGLANIRNLPADGSIADAILKPLPARKGASANDYRASGTR
jgi:hypothetical protein